MSLQDLPTWNKVIKGRLYLSNIIENVYRQIIKYNMISNGDNGYLVDVGCVDSISAGIEKLASMDSVQAKDMGQKARAKILELCSEENSLEKLVKLIEG